jgi:transcriptional regulator with XRE-family HTH domain
MTKTNDAVKILNSLFGDTSDIRQQIDEVSINIQVAELIYEVRTAAGLTQKQLADLIGTQQPAIARLEDADYEGHSLRMLQKVANALNKKVCISFIENKKISEVVSEAPIKNNVHNIGNLLLRKIDEWVEAGWENFENLGISFKSPQLEYNNSRFINELELESDLLESEILASEKLADTDPNNPLATVRRAKEFNNFRKPIALVISVSQASDPQLVNILLQIHSLVGENLSSDIQMILLDEQGNPEYFIDAPDEIISSFSDGKNKAIYLPFQYQKGETFGIAIIQGDIKVIENFLV